MALPKIELSHSLNGFNCNFVLSDHNSSHRLVINEAEMSEFLENLKAVAALRTQELNDKIADLQKIKGNLAA